jgi:hypothetical protein
VKLRDALGLSGWGYLAQQIRKGEHPDKKELIAALRRQEAEIPGEAQLYLARLLSGKIARRLGRPPKELQKLDEAYYFVRRVDRFQRVFENRQNRPNAQQLAFEKVAVEYGIKCESAERQYYRYKELLAPWLIATTDWKHKRIMAQYRKRWRAIGNARKRDGQP